MEWSRRIRVCPSAASSVRGTAASSPHSERGSSRTCRRSGSVQRWEHSRRRSRPSDPRRRSEARVATLNVAQLLVRCLENEGVRHVFGIPGEETLALNAALADSDKIKFVLTRHEQGAAFMADVYGRLSSYPGVCLATLGPGATNLITGVADAQ